MKGAEVVGAPPAEVIRSHRGRCVLLYFACSSRPPSFLVRPTWEHHDVSARASVLAAAPTCAGYHRSWTDAHPPSSASRRLTAASPDFSPSWGLRTPLWACAPPRTWLLVGITDTARAGLIARIGPSFTSASAHASPTAVISLIRRPFGSWCGCVTHPDAQCAEVCPRPPGRPPLCVASASRLLCASLGRTAPEWSACHSAPLRRDASRPHLSDGHLNRARGRRR